MINILIVEDEKPISDLIKLSLKGAGYSCHCVYDGEAAADLLEEQTFDLILLDINLPNVDGEYILKEFRKVSDIPVIMITSRDSEMDELLSMHYGADHYVTKPFNTQILLAKIRAVLKRTTSPAMQERMDCGGFVLNLSKSRIEKEENMVELTANELKIMKCLGKKKGNIVSREEIMNELWDSDAFIDDNTLTVNVTRIRKKLEEIGLEDVIVTKRGQGYSLSV